MKQAVPLSRYPLFFGVAFGVCAIDLWTKSWMFARLGMPDCVSEPWWIWPGIFGFKTNLNEGALFGVGQGLSWLFAAISAGAALAILLWLFPGGAASDRFLTVALAIMSAGILGNLYDRLGLPGLAWNDRFHPPHAAVFAVRDFIHVMIGPWAWPTFNIADCSLNCGAVLLVCHALFSRSDPEPAS